MLPESSVHCCAPVPTPPVPTSGHEPIACVTVPVTRTGSIVVGSGVFEQPTTVATNTSQYGSRTFGLVMWGHRLERNREVTKVTPIVEALPVHPERQSDLPAALLEPEMARPIGPRMR